MSFLRCPGLDSEGLVRIMMQEYFCGGAVQFFRQRTPLCSPNSCLSIGGPSFESLNSVVVRQFFLASTMSYLLHVVANIHIFDLFRNVVVAEGKAPNPFATLPMHI